MADTGEQLQELEMDMVEASDLLDCVPSYIARDWVLRLRGVMRELGVQSRVTGANE